MHQRVISLIQKIRDYGCYFILIVNIWCVKANIQINPNIVNKVYKEAVNKKAINNNCYLFYGASMVISEILNKMFNRKIYVKYVGRFKEGHFTWDNPKQTDFSNLIGRHDKGNKADSHFREVSHSGECLVDTWPELGYTKANLRGSRLFNVTEG